MLLLLLFIVLFFMNFFRSNRSADYSNVQVQQDLTAISTFDYSNVSSVEAQIRNLERKEGRTTFNVNKPMEIAQYRKAFKSSVIVGDSITEGLSSYGYLTEDNVFCKIGASIISGDELFTEAAEACPSSAFFAFGMNDMGNYRGDAEAFVEKYKTLLKEFQRALPETKIFVNSISIPSEDAIEDKPILAKYKKFNRALKTMCKDMGITFIDNSYIIKEHPDYYAADGIHVSADYYPLWLNNMILKAGL
jgi:hypothetical protein